MAFEVYHARMGKDAPKKKLAVSLSKNSIVLNKIAREKLNYPEHIELAYDNDNNIIRIRPVNNDNGGLPVKKTKLFARSFYKYFHINVGKGKYNADFIPEENALYVSLTPEKMIH
ncbi:MAG: hypothetical protein ABSC17_03710 [Thermacetogeniaceae bacterium]